MLTKQQNSRSRTRIPGVERRAQIVRVASRLFSGRGYESVTMKMLADECAVTEPALYRYFPSKEKIFEAVILALGSELEPELLREELSRLNDAESVLRAMATYIVNTFSTHTELQRLLYYSALGSHPQAQDAFDSVRKPFVDLLTEKLSLLLAENRICQIDPLITARCFVGMVMDCALGMHLWCHYQGINFKPEQVISNNVPIYARGLRPLRG